MDIANQTKQSRSEIDDDRYRAPALDRGLDILQLLSTTLNGLTRTEIVNELGLSASQIYRVLERLVQRGYVERMHGGDRYTLSMKLFILANNHPPLRRLVTKAQPLMDKFAQETGQACHLTFPQSGTLVMIAKASPTEHFDFSARIGAQLEWFNSSSSLTILAFQDEKSFAYNSKIWGIADGAARREPHLEQLTKIRNQGYLREPSKRFVGVTDLSAPLLDSDGHAIAAVTCAHILSPDENTNIAIEFVVEKLLEISKEISFDA